MKNLSSRVISAIIALIILTLFIYFGKEKGLYVIGLFTVVRASFEIARMFFNASYPKFTRNLFLIVSTLLFILVTQEELRSISGVALILSFIFLACFGILYHRRFKDLDQILSFVAKSCLGLVYTCFLPACIIWTSQTNNGMEWFLCLLAVVFAGDIGAYIFGSKFGKTKIAPTLSPNKSLEGSLGGLLFSTLVAFAFSYVLPNTPVLALVFCGLVGGFLGQVGDFFESLIKRVSGVKDSGTIMPGHGGILDRLDGVLLASPLFYLAANYFSL
ncbi:MAG: phosphatidate cytidylyltransferase [Bdellovibrio sp.]|nr:phosphatidate cytidylyltransferase [Bdellovibrio sp.]